MSHASVMKITEAKPQSLRISSSGFCQLGIYGEEIMNSAPTMVLDEREVTATERSVFQSEPAPLTDTPEISRHAWKVIIFLLVGGALFLASVGAYVFSGLCRFQDCL